MLTLQNMVFCELIKNILVEKDYRLTEHDIMFSELFDDLNVVLNKFIIKDKYTIYFINDYKKQFSITFKKLFKYYKKIVDICMVLVSEIDNINFNNIEPIKKSIDNFNDNLMYMLKRRDYTELYNNV